MDELKTISFHHQELIPAIVQDVNTKQVLMLAWMNAEALALTRRHKEAYFWSRSRQTIWHKGESSGNKLLIREIYLDCDKDTILLLVKAMGPACHTGHISCFYRNLEKNDV